MSKLISGVPTSICGTHLPPGCCSDYLSWITNTLKHRGLKQQILIISYDFIGKGILTVPNHAILPFQGGILLVVWRLHSHISTLPGMHPICWNCSPASPAKKSWGSQTYNARLPEKVFWGTGSRCQSLNAWAQKLVQYHFYHIVLVTNITCLCNKEYMVIFNPPQSLFNKHL